MNHAIKVFDLIIQWNFYIALVVKSIPLFGFSHVYFFEVLLTEATVVVTLKWSKKAINPVYPS